MEKERITSAGMQKGEMRQEMNLRPQHLDEYIGQKSAKENLKIFKAVSRALKSGGKHFMDVMNADHADSHFPCKLWDAGEKCLTLSNFEWNSETRILLYGQLDYPYGEPLPKPEMNEGNPIRLYSLSEVEKIFSSLGMKVCESYSDFSGKPSSENGIQLMVCSEKV